jgi:hypothetical protein
MLSARLQQGFRFELNLCFDASTHSRISSNNDLNQMNQIYENEDYPF